MFDTINHGVCLILRNIRQNSELFAVLKPLPGFAERSDELIAIQ